MLIVDTLLKEGKMSSIEKFSRKQESLFSNTFFFDICNCKEMQDDGKCQNQENKEAQIEGKI